MMKDFLRRKTVRVITDVVAIAVVSCVYLIVLSRGNVFSWL
ncbi:MULTISPECIES: hypothetical protein [unclassified Streptomyces]|jgi:hypothetical protein|uniref:Uncharacterized protein n=1 Tax=Streptomyces sp. NBC_01393 TaxID=2903851 RepID=A0AAU3HS98_9ACTN|nr:hypothetical protein [Streptomyces sp. NBC_00151]WRZ44092.1 hypothetical protein OG915_42250 [Streptomyces sp. NBC_00151]